MKTVDKALHVLDQFSLTTTEIGLSELARMAELDKAATRRILVAFAKHGFIEQSEETRKYRLGYGFLRLARIREQTVPVARAAQESTDWLVELTNETVHVSVPGFQGMTTIAHKLPNRGRVINIVPAQVLYYHATASGLAFLAFCSEDKREEILALKREKIADETLTSKADILKTIKQFQQDGFSHTRNSFENDVASLAMPFFREIGDPTGSIAIALPKAEMTPERQKELLPLLKEAVGRIERALTGL
ncbi:MAG: IclR family transcriptional regulator [Pseudomonadota bacterium]